MNSAQFPHPVPTMFVHRTFSPPLTTNHFSMGPPTIALLLLVLVFLLPHPSKAADGDEIPPQWTARQAVRFALRNNPDAAIAQARIAAAAADITSARAAFLPRLDLNTEYSRTNNPMYSFGNILNQGQFTEDIDFNAPGVTDTLQARASLQYRLYNGGRDRAVLAAADAHNQAARHRHATVRTQIGFEVLRGFHTILQAQSTVEARTSALKAIDAALAVAEARYREGTLLKEDLLNLQVQHARCAEDLIQAEHGLSLARRGFLHVLGLSDGTVRLAPHADHQQEIPVERDISNRPELAAMTATLRALEAEVQQARAGLSPSADLFGSYQIDKGLEFDDGSGNSWAAGVRVNYTLFDGQQAAAGLVAAQARLSGAREQLRRLEMTLRFEVEEAALGLLREEERLKVTAKMVALAEESARLARLRFTEGVLLAAHLIDSENRLTDARVSHALATASRHIAIADLRRAIGRMRTNDDPTKVPMENPPTGTHAPGKGCRHSESSAAGWFRCCIAWARRERLNLMEKWK
jgi:outer membrane protein TolC